MVYEIKYLGKKFTIRNKPIRNEVIETTKEHNVDNFITYCGYPMREDDVDDLLFEYGYYDVKAMTKRQKIQLLEYLDE